MWFRLDASDVVFSAYLVKEKDKCGFSQKREERCLLPAAVGCGHHAKLGPLVAFAQHAWHRQRSRGLPCRKLQTHSDGEFSFRRREGTTKPAPLLGPFGNQLSTSVSTEIRFLEKLYGSVPFNIYTEKIWFQYFQFSFDIYQKKYRTDHRGMYSQFKSQFDMI